MRPYGQPAVDNVRHRFEIKGRLYTPDDPCLFKNRCVPGDAKNWADHTMAWLSIIGRMAKNRAGRDQIVHRLVNNWLSVKQRKCIDCKDDVEALIAIAKLAAEYGYTWAHEDGWTIAPPDISTGWWPRPNLPVHPDLTIPEKRDNWIWWIVAAVAVVFFLSEGRRG